MIKAAGRALKAFTTDTVFFDIFKGALWAFMGRIGGTVFGLLATIIVAQAFGAEVLGIVSLVTAFVILLGLSVGWGMDTAMLQLIPQRQVSPEKSSVRQAYRLAQILTMMFSLLIGSLLFVFSELLAKHILDKPYLENLLKLMPVVLLFRAHYLLSASTIRALKLPKLFGFAQLLPQACFLGFLCVFFVLSSDKVFDVRASYAVLSYFAGTLFAGLFAIALVEINLPKGKHDESIIRNHDLLPKHLLGISSPMFATTIMTVFLGQIGIVFLGFYGEDQDIGYFSSALKLAGLIGFFVTSFNAVLGPTVSELYSRNMTAEIFRVAKKSARTSFYLTLIISITLAMFGAKALELLFGSEFASAYPLLVVLMLGNLITTISGPNTMLLNMTGKHSQNKNILFFAFSCSVVLNLILVPKYGSIGAAYAMLASITILNATSLVYVNRVYKDTTAYIPFLYGK